MIPLHHYFRKSFEKSLSIACAERMAEYWAERGYILEWELHHDGVDAQGRALFKVVTNMVNGFPVKRSDAERMAVR